MTRYFENYFHADPMTEIDEATAKADGYYAEELAEPRRFHRYIAGKLDAVLYPDHHEPAAAIADLQQRGLGVGAVVFSPLELGNVTKRFRAWDLASDGRIQQITDHELDENGRLIRESWSSAAGVLEGYRTFRYNEWGETAEVTAHAADGTITNREA